MADANEAIIQNLLKLPGNNLCADCGSEGIHRGLGVHISKVKHVKLDRWDDQHVERMSEIGNCEAKLKYEQHIPPSYRRPTQTAPHVLLEQWITAKYFREEFIRPERQGYLIGSMDGYLWKKAKQNSKFLPRRFLLSETEGVLKYFVKEKKAAKAVLRLAELNVGFAAEKVGHPNAMQLTFLNNGSTRHIYVQHDDPQTIVDWFQAIRCAKLHRLQVAFPSAPQHQLLSMLSWDFAMEGWLLKTGPKRNDGYRKRWFTLDGRKLMYHEHALDAHPKGEIFLGHMLSGYSVRVGVPPGVKDQGFTFTLRTPGRTFHMSAQREEERDSWIKAIEDTISRQLTPQDNSMAARLVRKRSSAAPGSIFSSR